MPATTKPLYATLEKPPVTLVLRRRSPAWELTIHNKAPTSLWLDHRTVIAEDDTLTISRRSRHPDFRLKISDHPSAYSGTTRTLQIDSAAVTVTTTYAEPVPTLPLRVEFAPLPQPPPTYTAPTLPLEVTVLPPHEDQTGYTLLRLRNTSTTDRLTVDGCDMPPGSSLTFNGREITSPLLRQFHVTTADTAMYLASVWNDELRETLICEPIRTEGRLYRCANPPLEVLVTPRPHADPEVLFHNTAILTDLWVAEQNVPPGYWVKGGTTTTVMSPITSCECTCTVSNTEVTLTITNTAAILPLTTTEPSHATYITPGSLPRLDRAKGPFDITIVEPPVDPDTATDAVNTLLRALATTHQAVATEILAARGLTPAQITAILGGLAVL